VGARTTRREPQRNSVGIRRLVGLEACSGSSHGAACVLTGCDPVQFSSTYFIGNKTGLSDSATRTISLGGTLFNLVLGLAFLALLRMIGPGAPARRYYVLWFGSMVNLVSATGYIFFGSAFAFGDYHTILKGVGWPLRIGCILLGAVLYFGALWVAARTADPLLGSGPDRRSRLFALVLLPAIVSSTILSASALLSPVPEAAIFSFIGHLYWTANSVVANGVVKIAPLNPQAWSAGSEIEGPVAAPQKFLRASSTSADWLAMPQPVMLP
jgi:hypothetical protein